MTVSLEQTSLASFITNRLSVRRALSDAPENVATLVRFLSTRLFDLLIDHTFPTPASAGVASLASSIMKTANASTQRDPTKEALNCLRVLQRVLPVIFEAEFEEFERKLLWEPEEDLEGGANGRSGTLDERPQFVIDDEDDEDDASSPGPSRSEDPGDDSRNPGSSGKSEVKKKALPTLAERLISCTIDLLFCCGFTLPAKIQVDHHKINYVIW